MRKNFQTAALCITAALSLTLSPFTACPNIQAEELTSNITAAKIQPAENTEKETAAATDFSVRLFQQCLKADPETNVMVSPFSVLYALGMTANGARQETLSQMEEVFGLSADELNLYLYTWMNSLSSDKTSQLTIADSIWLKDDDALSVNQDFLQTNTDYYNASIYKEPFDKETLSLINSWVNDNTDGMIPEILKELPSEAVMYLVNAIAFQGKWLEPYEEDQIVPAVFTDINGSEQDADMMYSTESRYLEDDEASGFLKYYEGSNYAFAALLPKENVSITDYAASFTGEKLSSLLSGAEETSVDVCIPVFTAEYDTELSKVLKDMGMTDAFDITADFSGLGTSDNGNIFINHVLHKTYISVDAQGTKAAAATAVEMAEASYLPSDKTVYLDRPFLYMIVDCETGLPVFMGTLTSC